MLKKIYYVVFKLRLKVSKSCFLKLPSLQFFKGKNENLSKIWRRVHFIFSYGLNIQNPQAAKNSCFSLCFPPHSGD